MKPPNRGTCEVHFPDGHLGVSPTLIGLARALSEVGLAVIVYGAETEYAEIGPVADNVQLVRVRRGGPWLTALAGLKVRVIWRLRRLAPFLESVVFTVRVVYLRFQARRRQTANKSVGIGVNLDGAITALINAWLFREPFIFLSLEMRRKPTDYRWAAALWRWLARKSIRRAEGVVIQGPDRLDILARQYGWQPPRVWFLPNSAGPRNTSSAAGNRLRRMFSLADAVPIALQAGMIDDAACSLALAQAFSGLPGWALVFHERRERSLEEAYITRLRETNSQNLYLSLKPVPFDDLGEILDAATVGLAFYDAAAAGDEALTAMSSSGKFALYLRHAKPVLVSGNLPALAGPVEEFRCGVAIADPADGAEIREALEQIVAHYGEYSRNARRCYEARFDFDERVKPLVSFVRRLVDEGAPP